MELNDKEVIKKMVLDSQEMIRDFEVYSKQVKNQETSELFKKFAEECGSQAVQMKNLLKDKF